MKKNQHLVIQFSSWKAAERAERALALLCELGVLPIGIRTDSRTPRQVTIYVGEETPKAASECTEKRAC
jgi:hypothetical protein